MTGLTTVTKKDSGMYIANVEGLTAKLDRYTDNMLDKAIQGLKECGGELSAEAVKLTPVDVGEMRARSFVSDVYVNESGNLEIAVGFERHGVETGTVNPKSKGVLYAVPLHERTNVKHKVGQAKFLETARNNFEREFLQSMREYCKEAKP